MTQTKTQVCPSDVAGAIDSVLLSGTVITPAPSPRIAMEIRENRRICHPSLPPRRPGRVCFFNQPTGQTEIPKNRDNCHRAPPAFPSALICGQTNYSHPLTKSPPSQPSSMGSFFRDRLHTRIQNPKNRRICHRNQFVLANPHPHQTQIPKNRPDCHFPRSGHVRKDRGRQNSLSYPCSSAANSNFFTASHLIASRTNRTRQHHGWRQFPKIGPICHRSSPPTLFTPDPCTRWSVPQN